MSNSYEEQKALRREPLDFQPQLPAEEAVRRDEDQDKDKKSGATRAAAEASLPLLEEGSCYRTREQIRVPTEVRGPGAEPVTLEIAVLRAGAQMAGARVPLTLSEAGVGRHDWNFTPRLTGRYSVRVTVVDSLGARSQTVVNLRVSDDGRRRQDEDDDARPQLLDEKPPEKKDDDDEKRKKNDALKKEVTFS